MKCHPDDAASCVFFLMALAEQLFEDPTIHELRLGPEVVQEIREIATRIEQTNLGEN